MSWPEKTLRLGIFRLELGDPGLATEALADLPRGGGFEKEVDGFAQVGEGGFRGGALAGNVQIRIEGDVLLAFLADDGGEAGFHLLGGLSGNTAIGQDTEHKGLHFGDGLIPGGSVGHGAGDHGNFGDPAAVLLAFDLYFHLGSFGRV